MFIDSSYFQIKNLTYLPNSQKDAIINDYISRYEKEVMLLVFGRTLYDLIIANKSETSGIYYDLINGKTYEKEVNGSTYSVRWNGLANTDKHSFLADYVWIKYVEQKQSEISIVCKVDQTEDEFSQATAYIKQVQVYEDCANLIGDWTSGVLEESLYNFMVAHIEDYPSWVFTKPNVFGANKYNL